MLWPCVRPSVTVLSEWLNLALRIQRRTIAYRDSSFLTPKVLLKFQTSPQRGRQMQVGYATLRFYSGLPQNGDKVPKFVVFWTISTIQDEKSAAKFHYIKTLSGKVVAQLIRVVSMYWQGVAPFP